MYCQISQNQRTGNIWNSTVGNHVITVYVISQVYVISLTQLAHSYPHQ